MEIIQVLVIGIIAAIIAILLKDDRPEIAFQLSLVAGIIIFMMMINKVSIVIQAIEAIAKRVNINTLYLNIIMKIIGVSYIASFGIEICKDSGQRSIAEKIEFAGKIIIISLAIPILLALLDMVQKVIP